MANTSAIWQQAAHTIISKLFNKSHVEKAHLLIKKNDKAERATGPGRKTSGNKKGEPMTLTALRFYTRGDCFPTLLWGF